MQEIASDKQSKAEFEAIKKRRQSDIRVLSQDEKQNVTKVTQTALQKKRKAPVIIEDVLTSILPTLKLQTNDEFVLPATRYVGVDDPSASAINLAALANPEAKADPTTAAIATAAGESDTEINLNNSPAFKMVAPEKLDSVYRQVVYGLAAKQNAHIKTLSMSNCNLMDSFGVELAEMLRTNTSITDLNLESNALGSVAVKALAATLATNTTLLSVRLQNQSVPASAEVLLSAPTFANCHVS
jgi:hypothetical protein